MNKKSGAEAPQLRVKVEINPCVLPSPRCRRYKATQAFNPQIVLAVKLIHRDTRLNPSNAAPKVNMDDDGLRIVCHILSAISRALFFLHATTMTDSRHRFSKKVYFL